MNDTLPEQTIIVEIQRLLGPEVLGWWRTQEGLDWHLLNKNTSHVYGIYAAMIEHLVEDATKQGMRPAYIIGHVALRLWACMPEYRDEIKRIMPDFDALDAVYLDDRMEQLVEENRAKLGKKKKK